MPSPERGYGYPPESQINKGKGRVADIERKNQLLGGALDRFAALPDKIKHNIMQELDSVRELVEKKRFTEAAQYLNDKIDLYLQLQEDLNEVSSINPENDSEYLRNAVVQEVEERSIKRGQWVDRVPEAFKPNMDPAILGRLKLIRDKLEGPVH